MAPRHGNRKATCTPTTCHRESWQEAFTSDFRHRLFAYALALCRRWEDAEEVVQETLLRVFEKRNQVRDPDRVLSWAFKIAKNVYRMRERRSKFAPIRTYSLDHLTVNYSESYTRFVLDMADSEISQEMAVILAQTKVHLHVAIRELPTSYASVVRLRHFEELSTQEVADKLGTSPDAIKTRLHRAHRMLRARLSPACGVTACAKLHPV